MSAIEYCKLTKNDIPLLLEAISTVLKETGAHDLKVSSEQNWNWQYKDLPSNESHVYLAKDEERIVGYYHIPIYDVKIADRSLKIGQIQTVAILADYRGKGVFQKLAEFANKDINAYTDLIYTFPNHKSIHTFIKYNNFKLVSALPVYILPLKLVNIIPYKLKFLKSAKFIWSSFDAIFRLFSKSLHKNDVIKLYESVSPEVEKLFSEFEATSINTLVRDKEFLDWRYMNSPKGIHKIYGLTDKDELKSVVIVKEEEIFSSKGLMVMDFAYQTPKDLQKLLSRLHTVVNTTTSDIQSFIFISGLNAGLNYLKYCGFISVPQKFVPRQLNLLARWTKKETHEDLTDPSSWLITIGDWDVF